MWESGKVKWNTYNTLSPNSSLQIRQQTNVHRFTVQCVLPINLFNEKIFIFIWFWLFAMAVVSLVSIVHWLARQTILSTQTAYVRRQVGSSFVIILSVDSKVATHSCIITFISKSASSSSHHGYHHRPSPPSSSSP